MHHLITNLLATNPAPAVCRVANAAGDTPHALYIDGVISADYGVSAAAVRDALATLPDGAPLAVYINSPGGDIFEGRAIMAELSRYTGPTVARIDSLCASAATSIALACGRVEMTDGAFFMIHNAATGSYGDKNALRTTATLLEKVESSIVADYTAKTGKTDADVLALMDAETWFDANEAHTAGFVDAVLPAPVSPGASNRARWNLANAYKHPPQAFSAADLADSTQQAEAPCSARTRNANALSLALA